MAKIGEVVLKFFLNDPVSNGYLGPNIQSIALKTYSDEIGQAFIAKSVKDLLHLYSQNESHKKNPLVAKPQPNYFGHKGNSSKVNADEVN